MCLKCCCFAERLGCFSALICVDPGAVTLRTPVGQERRAVGTGEHHLTSKAGAGEIEPTGQFRSPLGFVCVVSPEWFYIFK